MTYSIAALGEGGAGIVRAMLHANTAGVLGEGTYRITLIGVSAEEEQTLTEAVRDMAAVRAHLKHRSAPGFAADFSLHVWPGEERERLSLNDQAQDEEDELLCRALFTREQATLSPRHALDVSGPVAAMTFSSLLSGGEGDALWSLLDAEGGVLLCGSLCEPIGAAGIPALADYVARCGGEKPCAALLLPVSAGDGEELCHAALLSGNLDERLRAAFAVGMPEGWRMSEHTGAHLTDWLTALEGIRLLQDQRTGVFAWAMPEGAVSWKIFGGDAEHVQRCYDGALRASGMMNALYGPQLCAALASRNWLRDRMLTWYARHFDAARKLEDEEQAALIQDVQSLMAVYGDLAAWLLQVQECMPITMRWSQAVKKAEAEAEAHYAQVMELAGQIAWLRFEAERSGMVFERFVHRHSMQDSEAEATMRQIEEMQSHLDDLLAQQYQLNDRLGGALTRRMLKRMHQAAEREAEELDTQAQEGRRRIAKAAEIATLEEMPKVEAARARLERMERHVALLRGRAAQAERDVAYYEDDAHRKAPPKLETGEEKPDTLYPEDMLRCIQSLTDAEGKVVKQLSQILYDTWPWPAQLPRQITDAMGERPQETTEDSLGDFLAHLLAVTGEYKGEEEKA